jgi:hypothetical protein
MRPKIAKLEEVKAFFNEANKEDIVKLKSTLFDIVEGVTIPAPNNQHELVLYTLIYPPKELSMAYWMNAYKSHKFSSRLGELEKKLSTTLVERKQKSFTNRFGHDSSYTVYIPILSKAEYVDLYMKLKNNNG